MLGSVLCFSNCNYGEERWVRKLESRELSKQVHKNKYQMPNIEELMDTVGQTINQRKTGDVYFSTLISNTLTV